MSCVSESFDVSDLSTEASRSSLANGHSVRVLTVAASTRRDLGELATAVPAIRESHRLRVGFGVEVLRCILVNKFRLRRNDLDHGCI